MKSDKTDIKKKMLENKKDKIWDEKDIIYW